MRRWLLTERPRRRFYPWPLMEIGDYFFAAYRYGRAAHEEQRYMVRQCCWATKRFGKKFRTRQTSLGIKITRIS